MSDDPPLSEGRMQLLTRVYHSAGFASEATGFKVSSLTRAARRYGLTFRHQVCRGETGDGSMPEALCASGSATPADSP